jgi:large subunit ribosomal protein L21
MYAVIQTGGKQYRVAPGDTLRIETLAADAGQVIEVDRVLMIANEDGSRVGRPFIDGGKVTATVTAHGRHPKIRIIKFRRRKHHMKQMGHRQNYTEIRIDGISG